jgi:hypothetical protein
MVFTPGLLWALAAGVPFLHAHPRPTPSDAALSCIPDTSFLHLIRSQQLSYLPCIPMLALLH